MWRFARRTVHGILIVAGVSVFTFVLLSAAPGNFFDELKLNSQISPETVKALAIQYGFDRPLPVRYEHWLASAARGEFGYSLSYRCAVGSLLWRRAGNTLLLAGLATLLAWTIAVPWGVLEALDRGGWIDRVGGIATAILITIPEVLIALLSLLFAARTGWFPTGGMAAANSASGASLKGFWDLAVHLALPVVALVAGLTPVLVRHVRTAMVAVLNSPFVDAARGHGIPKWRLVYRHAFPVAANALISFLGFSIGALLSMSLLVEIVLSWPGLGPLVLEAILARDVHVVMAVVMLSSVFLVAGNLLADTLLYCSDPRIRAMP
jgi:peptide/nickel transport system permease protein